MLIADDGAYYRLCQRVQALGADEILAIDTETTGLKLWTTDVLRGVCLGFRGESYYVSLSHPHSWNANPQHLRFALRHTAALPVLHNAPFDATSLSKGLGYELPWHRYRDTQIIAWLEDENRRKSLKYLGARFFGEDEAAEQRYLKQLFRGKTQADCYRERRQWLADTGTKEPATTSKDIAAKLAQMSKRDWATITAEQIAAYAAKDADLTARVYDHLLKQAEYAAIEPAVVTMHNVAAAAYRMSKHGVMIDPKRVALLASRATERADAIAAEFDVNLDSPKQLAALVYGTWGLPCSETTDGGAQSTSAAALEALAGEHDGLDLILEYRRARKSVSSFYDTLLENMDTECRVHPWLNVVGTVTGRWSCSCPNLQQIPKASTNIDAKTVFEAPVGMSLVSFDLVSAELRIAAALAGDAEMMAALDEPDRNFHKETARAVFGQDEEPHYTLAKNLNYGIPYGIGPRRFATYIAKGLKQKQTSVHYSLAKAAIDAHRVAWPELHAAIRNCSAYADVTGRLPLGWPGRVRHFTSATMGYPVPSYTAINALVQGSVAMFVNDVLLGIEAPAAELGAVPVLAVHDSLCFEVPVGAEDQLGAVLQIVSDDLNPFKLRMLFESKPGL